MGPVQEKDGGDHNDWGLKWEWEEEECKDIGEEWIAKAERREQSPACVNWATGIDPPLTEVMASHITPHINLFL